MHHCAVDLARCHNMDTPGQETPRMGLTSWQGHWATTEAGSATPTGGGLASSGRRLVLSHHIYWFLMATSENVWESSSGRVPDVEATSENTPDTITPTLQGRG